MTDFENYLSVWRKTHDDTMSTFFNLELSNMNVYWYTCTYITIYKDTDIIVVILSGQTFYEGVIALMTEI